MKLISIVSGITILSGVLSTCCFFSCRCQWDTLQDHEYLSPPEREENIIFDNFQLIYSFWGLEFKFPILNEFYQSTVALQCCVYFLLHRKMNQSYTYIYPLLVKGREFESGCCSWSGSQGFICSLLVKAVVFGPHMHEHTNTQSISHIISRVQRSEILVKFLDLSHLAGRFNRNSVCCV